MSLKFPQGSESVALAGFKTLSINWRIKMQNEIYTEDLLLCAFLWLNVTDTVDDAYDELCHKVHRRLSDEQMHALEEMFYI